jgi:DNA-binding FrmR family transcriptional regulator
VTRAVTHQEAPQRDKSVRDRLRRAEGQVAGAVRMIDEGRACEDVVTQLMAARAAIDHAAAALVADHVDECVATLSRPRARTKVRDAVALFTRLS